MKGIDSQQLQESRNSSKGAKKLVSFTLSWKDGGGRRDGYLLLSNVHLIKFWKHSCRIDCSAPCHGEI